MQVEGLVGCFLGGDREDIHSAVGFRGSVIPGIFQHPRLEGDVQEVAVHGVGLLEGGLDRYVMGLGVGDHFATSGELFAEAFLAPGGDDFHLRGEAGSAQFETNLVIALAGGPVGHGIRTLLEGDVQHSLRDTGTGDGGAEKIAALVDRIGLEHGEDVIAGEFLPHVADKALTGPGVEGLFLKAVQFFSLANVRAEGNHIRVIGLLQPGQQDGGVQSSGIGDDDFHGRGS